MKRALVTGGAGFIGSALTKRLHAEGYSVDIVDNLSSGFVKLVEDLPLEKITYLVPEGEYESFEEVEGLYSGQTPVMQFYKGKPGKVLFMHASFAHEDILIRVRSGMYDVVFHEAAIPRVSYSVENPVETTQANLLDSIKLFKAAADTDTPVVWASSSSVYGGADNLPTREEERGVNLPKSPYAMQKYHLEDYAELFGQLYGLRSVGLRYFNVFGPGQYAGTPYSTAVSAWCHAIKEGVALRSDGDGEQTRDMCYIDNVVDANIKAAETILDGALFACHAPCFNVACGDRVSNNDILAHLSEKFGDRVKIRSAPERPGDVKHTLADVTLAQETLGYEVLVPFWEGLAKTIEWWGLEDVND